MRPIVGRHAIVSQFKDLEAAVGAFNRCDDINLRQVGDLDFNGAQRIVNVEGDLGGLNVRQEHIVGINIDIDYRRESLLGAFDTVEKLIRCAGEPERAARFLRQCLQRADRCIFAAEAKRIYWHTGARVFDGSHGRAVYDVLNDGDILSADEVLEAGHNFVGDTVTLTDGVYVSQ